MCICWEGGELLLFNTILYSCIDFFVIISKKITWKKEKENCRGFFGSLLYCPKYLVHPREGEKIMFENNDEIESAGFSSSYGETITAEVCGK